MDRVRQVLFYLQSNIFSNQKCILKFLANQTVVKIGKLENGMRPQWMGWGVWGVRNKIIPCRSGAS